MPLSGTALALRIVLAALVIGLIAGAFTTLLQSAKTEPLIRAAEVFEHAAEDGAAKAESGSGETQGHSHDAEAWEPAPGAERWAFTLLANVLAAIGYGLVLLAAFALRPPASWREGLLWGLAGFAAFVFAPMLGVPPSLPGTELPDLAGRQAWWIGTALATAGGIALIVFANANVKPAGFFLLVIPHLIGGPRAEGASNVPAELATQFVSATLLTNVAFWLVLGALAALAHQRFVARKAT